MLAAHQECNTTRARVMSRARVMCHTQEHTHPVHAHIHKGARKGRIGIDVACRDHQTQGDAHERVDESHDGHSAQDTNGHVPVHTQQGNRDMLSTLNRLRCTLHVIELRTIHVPPLTPAHLSGLICSSAVVASASKPMNEKKATAAPLKIFFLQSMTPAYAAQ